MAEAGIGTVLVDVLSRRVAGTAKSEVGNVQVDARVSVVIVVVTTLVVIVVTAAIITSASICGCLLFLLFDCYYP